MRRTRGITLLCIAIAGLVPNDVRGQAAATATVVDSATVQRTPALPRLGSGQVVAAVSTSCLVGLGIGHAIIGEPARGRVFLQTQLGGAGVAIAGLVIAFATKFDGGLVLVYGGAATWAGSRVWEFGDLLHTMSRRNRRAAAP